MKRLILALLCLLLGSCGSGGNGEPGTATVEPAPPPGAAIVRVNINEDYRKDIKDDFQPYLVNVTFATEQREFNIEYCDTPIHVGDKVNLASYGPGTTLIYVNGVMVGDIIDWEETNRYIDNPSYEDWSIKWL